MKKTGAARGDGQRNPVVGSQGAERRTPGAVRVANEPGDGSDGAGPALDLRLRLLGLTESLAKTRSNFEPEVAPAEPGTLAPKDGTVVSRVRRVLHGLLLGTDARPRHGFEEKPGAVKVNDPLDVTWAQHHASLESLVHVFHQDWHGIRAAAGYLPGQKVAVSFGARLTLRDLQAIVEECASASAVVFHGWSNNMTLVARALRETLGKSPRLVVVWHGNTAQFINPFEVKQVALLIELRREGVIDQLASVKPDLHLLDDAFEKDVLLNVGPRTRAPQRTRTSLESALIPVPLDWRKNLHTNLFACSAAGLRSVYVTAPLGEDFPFTLKCELLQVDRPSRAELLAIVASVDVVMNASLSECQPMTALEALSVRVPCLTGPLALGALDEHPYQALVQIAGVDSIGPVVNALGALREVLRDPDELRDMMTDYEDKLMREAMARYERILA